MIHADLIEMLDDLARHVDRMRREARTIVPESLAAITLRVQADALERCFLTCDVTGEVFPNLGADARLSLLTRIRAREEGTRIQREKVRPHPPADAKPIDCLRLG